MTEAVTDTVENLAVVILDKRMEVLTSKIKNRPRKTVYASSIPTCVRQGVYELIAWDKKKLHDVDLQARFQKGDQEETALIRELGDLGFKVVEQQVSIEKTMGDRYNLAGRIDGKLLWEGHRYPFEIKSLHPRAYAKVNILDDVKTHRFYARYYRQVQVYLLGHNEDAGLLILTDCLGHWKIIPVHLDYEAAEAVLKVVEEINKHVKAGTLPDRISYADDECTRCSFAHICLPDVIANAAVAWKDDKELEDQLARRENLAQAAKEYEKLDDSIKAKMREIPLAVVGRFIVSGKWQSRKAYEVPDEVKAQYLTKQEIWLCKIESQDEPKEVE